MTEVINVHKEIRKAKKRFILNLIFITIFIGLYITSSLFLLLLSKRNYLINLVITISLSVLCLSFIVFYFLNIFPIVNHYHNLYCKMEHNTCLRKRTLFYEREDDFKIVQNIKYRQLFFSHEEQGKKYIDRIYLLDAYDLKFDEGKAYRLGTFQNIIIQYEEVDNAKA